MQTHAYRHTLKITHGQMLKIRHTWVSFTRGYLHKVCFFWGGGFSPAPYFSLFFFFLSFFLSCVPWLRWNKRSVEMKYSLMEYVGERSAWLEAQNQATKLISLLCYAGAGVCNAAAGVNVCSCVRWSFCAVYLCSSINVCSSMLPFLFICH